MSHHSSVLFRDRSRAANLAKAFMSLSRTVALTSKAILGIGPAFLLSLSTVAAEGIAKHSTVLEAAVRCTDFGPGFVDMGNGTCMRSGGHVRVGSRNADAWSTDGTSNAGLRSDSSGMLGGAGDTGHLRVRSGLESLSPFR